MAVNPLRLDIKIRGLQLDAKKIRQRVDFMVKKSTRAHAFELRNAMVAQIVKQGTGGQRHSRPGQPPRFKYAIFRVSLRYAYDQRTKSAPVGYALLPRLRTNRGVPRALEFGEPSLTNRNGPLERQDNRARPLIIPTHRRLVYRYAYKFRGAFSS